MSCYIVDDKVIEIICNFILQNDTHVYWGNTIPKNQKRDFPQILMNENYRSYNYRYNETGEAHEVEFKKSLMPQKLSTIVEAINNYAYQACETPDWKNSFAYAIIQGARLNILNLIPKHI